MEWSMRRAVVFSLICLGASFAASQQATHPSAVPSVHVPFDPNQTSLSRNFEGDRADVLYGLIAQKLRAPEKSDFESSSAYQQRMDAFTSTALSGKVAASDRFVFVLGGHSGATKVESKYDADNKQLMVYMPFSSPDNRANWQSTSAHLGSYVGSNSFGVKKLITRVRETDLDIEFSNFEWLRSECTIDYVNSCLLQVDPTIASLFSAHPRILVTGTLTGPFISAENTASDATIDDPEEVHAHHSILHLSVDSIWIFDGATGIVLKQYSRAHAIYKDSLKVQAGDIQAAPEERWGKVSISADVASGMLLHKEAPVYPTIARAARVSGTVVLQATISSIGSIVDLRVVSGPAILQQAALDAVKLWQYRPYLQNNKPVSVETTVNVIFSLSD
jgi:TonB family protein